MKAQKRFWRIVRTVSCDSRIISGIFRRSDERIVTIAVSIAMSLPRPMATLKSACARAALSLIPSPAMATVRPSDCNCRTNPAFFRQHALRRRYRGMGNESVRASRNASGKGLQFQA